MKKINSLVLLLLLLSVGTTDVFGMRRRRLNSKQITALPYVPYDVWGVIVSCSDDVTVWLSLWLVSKTTRRVIDACLKHGAPKHSLPSRWLHVTSETHKRFTTIRRSERGRVQKAFFGRKAVSRFDAALSSIVATIPLPIPNAPDSTETPEPIRLPLSVCLTAGGDNHLERLARVLNSQMHGDKRQLVTEIVLDVSSARFSRNGVRKHIYENFPNLSCITLIRFGDLVTETLIAGMNRLENLSSITIKGSYVSYWSFGVIFNIPRLKSLVLDNSVVLKQEHLARLHERSGQTLECLDVQRWRAKWLRPIKPAVLTKAFPKLITLRLLLLLDVSDREVEKYLQGVLSHVPALRCLILDCCDRQTLTPALRTLVKKVHTFTITNKTKALSDAIVRYVGEDCPTSLRELRVVRSAIQTEEAFRLFPGLRWFQVGQQRFCRGDFVAQLCNVDGDVTMTDCDEEETEDEGEDDY